MVYHAENAQNVIDHFKSDVNNGLGAATVKENALKYGANVLKKKKGKGFFARIGEALAEPMILILIFSFVITLGTNIGKALKTGDGDFIECIGIFLAIALSVGITLFMESSSEKAFAALSDIYDKVSVRAIRGGEPVLLTKDAVVAGDILLLSGGDKLVADGRVVESEGLSADES